MDQEQINQWYNLEADAMSTLRKGSDPCRRGVGRVMHLLVLPSFEAAEGWEAYRDVSDELQTRYFVIFTGWDREGDQEKFGYPFQLPKQPHTPSPTLSKRQFPVESGYMEDMLQRFSALSLTPSPQNNILGLDGTSYEVKFGDPFASSHFTWWEKGPSAWHELTRNCQDLLQELRRLAQEAGD